ncbi:D-amino-acid transaminase [Sutcliffiella rhizosphaerae]|uniref:D-alanine aminotransferase n=1 Tax=Sutcliffiella rhizosphaerae TaxID=2880967 RepID=A0ABN8A951_9BACI|nr:D-amino-acid transaminase [Sutcliffiella rhizosphaerae]CAG9621629.1 D-alanine aminotransferase [Sutcliffiella rhizosphaerae]
MKVLVNESILDKEAVKIDFEDRGYQFGDGVYEVINIYNGVPFTFNEHIERLYRSAQEIGMSIPYSPEKLKENLMSLLDANNVIQGGLYLQITRGTAPRTHHYDEAIESKLIAYPLPHKDVLAPQTNGVTAITEEDLRWLRCDIKSLNLLYNIMSKQKAAKAGAFETILIREEIVTEGTSSNIFIVKDGMVKTHPANNKILNGITRMKLLQIVDQHAWEYQLEPFTKSELLEADEVFLTSTTSEIMPIIKVDDVVFHDGIPGPMTQKLQSAFREAVEKDIQSYEKE